MAPATVRQVHAILRRALDQAARWGWIPANPAALASPPRLGSAEIRPPTPEEVSRLLEAAYGADPDFAVLLWLAATTGARRGELCALRWGSIDLEAAELLILRSLFQAAGRLVEKDTKTHAARRLALSEDSVALWRSIGAAAPSGRRPAARGSPTMPMCSPSTRLAGSPCTRTR
jgi:integrase